MNRADWITDGNRYIRKSNITEFYDSGIKGATIVEVKLGNELYKRTLFISLADFEHAMFGGQSLEPKEPVKTWVDDDCLLRVKCICGESGSRNCPVHGGL